MFIENVLKISGMTFAPAKDLKKPKYKKLDIFHDGWESIDLGNPPTGNEVVREVKTIISDIGNTTDKQKQQYINSQQTSKK